jgi:hypothetical protein
MDDWLKQADAVAVAQVARSTFIYHAAQGRIAFASTPAGRIFRREDVERYAREIHDDNAAAGSMPPARVGQTPNGRGQGSQPMTPACTA